MKRKNRWRTQTCKEEIRREGAGENSGLDNSDLRGMRLFLRKRLTAKQNKSWTSQTCKGEIRPKEKEDDSDLRGRDSTQTCKEETRREETRGHSGRDDLDL